MAQSKIVNLIETRSTVGKGTEDDPMREVIELFEFDGNRVVRIDPQLQGLIRKAYDSDDDVELRRLVQKIYDLIVCEKFR